MRVSTNQQFNTALDRLKQSNSNLGDLTYQVSSGLKARRFEDIANDSNQLLDLQELRLNTSTYTKNIDAAIARLNATENALQNLNDLMKEAASLWTLARNEADAATRATMAPKAEGLTETFYSVFNTKFEGRYIFSGQAGEKPPITATPTANTFPGDPPPTAYYNGDTAKVQAVVDSSNVQTYGVTGDDMAFARIKAGLEALWFGLENNNVADIDGAINLLSQAQSDLSDLQGEVGGQISSLSLIKGRHETNVTFLTERVDELEKVDVTEALTQFSQEEATLQASMLVITRLQQLTLLDYIR